MMKANRLLILLFLTQSVFSQIKGVVKDSLTGQPIPYVSIWSANENIGITSEENGTFAIPATEKTKQLIFSSLGFKKKTVSVSKAEIVYLSSETYQLDEVVLRNKKETKIKEIGSIDSSVLEAFDSQPKIDIKYFPYSPAYKKTKFIQKVGLMTDSRIQDASIKIHFYSVDENGFPGKELLPKDFIVTVNKGNKQTLFDVSKFNLTMPKNGIFVGFEKLMIERNKLESGRTYYPLVLYYWVGRDRAFTFASGKWNRKTQDDPSESKEKIMLYEPAINLILTN